MVELSAKGELTILKDFFKKLCCCHKWQRYKRVKTFEYDDDKLPSKITDTLICTKCGKIKKITL